MTPEIADWLQNHSFSVSDPVKANHAGIEPLIQACQQARRDIVDFFIGQNASLDVLDAYGNNALWAACYSESGECIAALLKAGIDINYQNPASGATALVFAASSGREQAVRQLLDAGADTRLKTHDDFSALDLASTRNTLNLLKSKS